MKKYWVVTAILATFLTAMPVFAVKPPELLMPIRVDAEPVTELSTHIRTYIEYIEQLEARTQQLEARTQQLEARTQQLEARTERIDYLEEKVVELNCLVAELINPEPEAYHEGLRVYGNLETTKACYLYRNPPGHLYKAPPGHRNPPGHTHYTTIGEHHDPVNGEVDYDSIE